MPVTYVAVSVGEATTCGVATDHSLWCWGQLPLRTDFSTLPERIGGDSDWDSAAVLPRGVCALKTNGALFCWGNDDSGTLGLSDGEHDPKFEAPKAVVGAEALRSLSGSETVTCGVRQDGTLWCWGDGVNGPRIVEGPRPQRVPRPVQVGTERQWTTVAVDFSHLCGLREDRTLWCENSVDHVGFQEMVPGTTWVSLVSSSSLICGTQQDGSFWCLPGGVPTHAELTASWKSVAIGQDYFCGLRLDDTLWCWGGNEFGQLGTDASVPPNTPVQVGQGADWLQVSAGRVSTCGLRKDGTLWCWGNNAQGTLGDGRQTPLTPVRIGWDRTWSTVSVGRYFSCALAVDGNRWCWGGEYNLGTPAWTHVTQAPTLADVDRHWRAYRLREATGLGVDDTGDVDAACLGTTTRDESREWSTVAAGTSFYCAIDGSGAAACAGDNSFGQLGSAGAPMTTSARVPLEGKWRAIATGSDDACGIRSDGSLFCWGNNRRAGWASAALLQSETPQAIDGIGAVSAVATDDGWTCAIETGGALSCWGTNGFLAAMGSAGSPVRYPQEGPWNAVALAPDHGCALHSDKSLWCFGANDSGQLGDGTRETRDQLTRLAGSDWSSVSTGNGDTCGIRVDGSLWCWGSNINGRRGDGTAWRGTPMRVAHGVIPTRR